MLDFLILYSELKKLNTIWKVYADWLYLGHQGYGFFLVSKNYQS